MNRLLAFAFVLLGTTAIFAADCQAHFTIAYLNENGELQPGGMTQEQGAFWAKEAPKRYSTLCFDPGGARWLVIWRVGLDAPPDLKQIAKGKQQPVGPGPWQGATFQAPTGAGMSSGTTWIAVRSKMVQQKAWYYVIDLSKDPAELARKGQGFRNAPRQATVLGRAEPGTHVSADSFSSTIADPEEALKNALDWIKKNGQ